LVVVLWLTTVVITIVVVGIVIVIVVVVVLCGVAHKLGCGSAHLGGKVNLLDWCLLCRCLPSVRTGRCMRRRSVGTP
jgi:hypothetical protein